MNESKRACLHGALDVITQIRKDEEQDLRDQPDNIEDSPYAGGFRANIMDLNSVIVILDKVIRR